MDNIVRIVIQPDYEKAESSGAEGMFQVISVYGYDENDKEFDLTNKVDQGTFFSSGSGVAKKLNLDPDGIDIEIED